MKTVTTSVGFQDALGNLVLSGKLILTLSQSAEVTSGGGLIAPKVAVLPLDAVTAKIASTQLWFNDELTPTGTTYHSELLDSGGNIIADFGQWSITGASADLSTMVPVSGTGLSTAGVVLLSPSGNQTITTGNLTLAAGGLSVTPSTTKRLVVDNNAALTTPGSFGVHTHSVIDTITPAPDQPTKFPLGDDGGFAVYGPADIHLMNEALEVTSTTSVGAPGSVTVTVTSPTVGGTAQAGNATALFSGAGGAALIIEPGGANQETIAIANWSIASASTLTITFAKTHTQPYRIRQQGVILSEGDIQAAPDRTSQLTQWYLRDGSGQINIGLSSATSVASWPLSGLQLGNNVTGGTNLTNGSMIFRMNNASSVWQFVNAANTQTLINLDNSGHLQTSAVGGQSNSGLQVASATPFIALDATGQAADQKWWDVGVVGTQLQFRAVNDANNAATNWLVVNRGAAQAVTSVGLGTIVGNYNSINTAGQGVPPIYGATSQKTESAADTNVLTFTPPAAVGSYRVRFTMAVSAQNTATLGWTATWKDANGSAQAPTNLALFTTGVAAPALTVTAATNGNYHGQLDIDTDNSATAIVVKLTFTGTSFTAKVSATVERLI